MTASQQRQRLAMVTALVVTLAVLAVVLLAGRATGEDPGVLVWDGAPLAVQAERRTDHILGGTIRNDSLHDLELRAADARIVGADGKPLTATVRFMHGFAHGLYAWSQKPEDVGDLERRRLGELVTLKPGQTAPLTLSWRVPPGGDAPRQVAFGSTALALP
jgi:hypothetical protein